jgi:hypothetical protein
VRHALAGIAAALALGAPAAALALGAPAVAHARAPGGLVPDVPGGQGHITHALRDHAADLPYNGGPVLHSNRTHVIFWQPSGSGLTFDPGYVSLVERFLVDVAADSHLPTNVYGLSGQYRDSHGPAAYSVTHGANAIARDALPRNGCLEPLLTGPGWPVCLTDQQLQNEIDHVVLTDHLPLTGHDVYFLVMPRGLGSCTDSTDTSCALGGVPNGYCGYHSQTPAGVLYAVIPYNAVPGHCQSTNPRPNSSTADPSISTLSHEHNEMVTDPLGNAWIDSADNEDGDLCVTSFGPVLGGSGATAWNQVIHGGHFFLQNEWSNDDGGCRPRDEADAVSSSGPRNARVHRTVRFTGHARDPDGAIVGYVWFFGDHRTGHGRVVKHAYRRRGRYRVVLRTTDRAGNWAFSARTIFIRR